MKKDTSQSRSPQQPRPLVLALMLTGILAFEAHPKLIHTANAHTKPVAFNNTTALVTGELISQNQGTIPNSYRQKAINAVLQNITKKFGVSRANLRVSETQEKTWPDGCLGLAEPGMMCTQSLIKGWHITVANKKQPQQVWAYRTNKNGSVVKLEK